MTLFWQTETPARRREGFPSWSWVGWETFAGFSFWERLVDGDDYVYDVKLSVQIQDGEHSTLQDHYKKHQAEFILE